MFQRTYWHEIKERIARVNPKIAKIIDKIAPTDYLYIAQYMFGSSIVQKGDFYIPQNIKTSMSINSSSKSIQKDFKYSGSRMPSGIITHNSQEVYIDCPDYTLPVLVSTPGSITALWQHLDKENIYHPVNLFSVTAGARCMFMGPNISDKRFHKYLLRDYDVQLDPPRTLLNQHEVFQQIVKYSNSDWFNEIIFFPDSWINKIYNDPEWIELYVYFMKNAWQSSVFERNQTFYKFSLSCIKENKNLKKSPYLIDTAYHLITLGVGTAPGFAPATNEELAPISLIQSAYKNSYRLSNTTPTIMVPAHFSMKAPNLPIYYSMHLPTLLEFSHKSRQNSSVLEQIVELEFIMKSIFSEIKNGNIYTGNTILESVVNDISYNYYHYITDKHAHIKNTTTLPHNDSRLTYNSLNKSNENFSAAGAFFRGCVALKSKTHTK